MKLQLLPKPAAFSAPQKVTKRSYKWPIVVIVLIVALFAGAGWYYFFGRKPKVAFSIPLQTKGDWHPSGLWAVGPRQIALFANGQVKLVDLGSRKELWSARIPQQQSVDPAWQQGVNARFVKVQQWADDLARKRAALTSAEQIKAFNAEAAKYHAELTAVRADAAKPRMAGVHAVQPVSASEPEAKYALGRDRAAVDKLNAVVSPEVRIIEERVKKRAAKLDGWRKSLDAKTASAKSDLQRGAVKEEEVRYQAELAEQKRDQAALEKTQAAMAHAPAESPDETSSTTSEGEFGLSKPHIVACGDRLWFIEAQQAVALDRATGAVKADVRLAGPAQQVFQGSNTVVVVANAGAEAVHVTKLTSSAQPQSLYLSTARHEYAFVTPDNATVPNVQKLRTDFSAANDSLLRADFRLIEPKIKTRDAIKKSSEKELEAAAGNAAAHSEDELKAVNALLANDAARMLGDGKERVDESTYEVTLRRPFEPNVPAWTGTLAGRAQLFSTPTLDLITAGTKLIAFDRSNKKLWEATLGAPVPIRRSDAESDLLPSPWLESGDKLFFADGAFLTALQSKTGQVLWRVPSVGIRKLQIDGDGNLYVLSDNLHVETLTYVLDSSLRDTIPLTVKIKAADGKIAWQREKYQDLWVSGNDVYVFRETKNAADIETQVFDRSKAIEGRVKIYKLSRGNGNPMWEWFQTRVPHGVVADGKSVALLFGSELQVIHSICW